MLRPMVPAAEFEKYGFKQCKGKWYENCYYLCVARGCVMLFVSDVCFDVFCWNEADPRIHKKPNCRYRDKRDYLDIVYDLIKAGLLTSEYEVRKMNTRNHEHYKDKTAHDAIKAADKPPNDVRETVENMRREANKRGFEVFGRIKLRDMKTGKIYR